MAPFCCHGKCMTEGIYRSGSSFLHRLDARVKLVLLFVVIICLFASFDLRFLTGLAGLAGLAAALAKVSPGVLWRLLKMMKWLLLCTLLLHLLLTPGRTLFGTSWLSYDGLINGLCVDSQLLLAVLFSLLLSWTTPPAELARALGWLLAPLRLVRVPVEEITGMVLLVMQFLPFIRQEIAQIDAVQKGQGRGPLSRFRCWAGQLEPLLLRLFDRADELARDIATDRVVQEPADTKEWRSQGLSVWATLCAAALCVVLFWRW